MSTIQVTFQLTGANAGRTMTLRGKYQFVDGRTTLTTTPEQMALHAKALAVNWSAYPLGDPRLNPKEAANEQRDISQGSQRDGDQDVQGNGGPEGLGTPAGEPGEVGQGAAEAGAGQSDVPASGDGHPQGMTVLLGSNVLPTFIELSDKRTVQLGEVVNRAFKDSGLDVAGWNGLNEPDRENCLADAVNTMKMEQAAAEADLEPKALTNLKLVRALGQLDPKDDKHWTKDGKPAMTAVEAFYGASDITRADVSAAVPGLTRATAPAKE